MSEDDRNDIIKKLNTAGKKSDENNNEVQSDDSSVSDTMGVDDSNNGGGGDLPNDTENTNEPLQEIENDFLTEPVKNNMFQPKSNDEIKDNPFYNSMVSYLNEASKFSNDKEIAEPEVKPNILPNETKPLRRHKPFLPMPNVEPKPKAEK